MARQHEGQQGAAATPPTLLGTKRITTLTDAAARLFSTLANIERDAKQAAKARLKVEMDKLDLFGLTANCTDSEAREYQSEDERSWCP